MTERSLSELMAGELFDLIPDGLVVVDHEGIIRSANEQMSALVGRDPGELVGQELSVLLPVHITDEHVNHSVRYWQDPTRRPLADGGKLWIRHADGAELPVRISLAPIMTDEGSMVIAAVRDMTESSLADRRLEDAVARRFQMELRERMGRDLHDNVIQHLFAVGMSLQVSTNLVDDEALRNRLGDSVERIDMIIRQIRDVICGQPLARTESRLNGEVLQLVASWTPSLGCVPTLQLDPEIDEFAPPDLCDDILAVIREGLANVSRHSNAVDVDVSMVIEADHIVVSITDDGIGFVGDPSRSGGLANLGARATGRGGSFDVHSDVDSGTRLRWSVPAPS